MKKNKKPEITPIKNAKDSLIEQVKDLPFFMGVEIEGEGVGSILVIRFSKEPPFKILTDIPLSYCGYYVKTKIEKSKTK